MKKIVVIEDEARTREVILECLAAEGYAAIGAANGLLGVHQVQAQLPDLVICDIGIPELDGYGVLDALRQDPVTAPIPFIFLSAKSTRAERRQGMDLGADDYLTKPTTVGELLGAIAARLRKQAIHQLPCGMRLPESGEPISDFGSTAPFFSAIPDALFSTVPQLRQVFDFIEANYHQPITLSDVAQAVGYSRSYLTHLVSNHTGQTVNRWIVERRMAEARNLLQETGQSAEQIAASVGYQNIGHFFRQFRQHHGVTPCVWRRNHQAAFNQS